MKWQSFLDSLDSAGGHILILTGGVLVGCVALKVSVTDGHTIIVASGAALLALLRQKL